MNQSKIKLFLQYIKFKKFYIVLFLLITLIFSFVIYLYNQSLEPIIYSAVLCFYIGIVVLVIGFAKFYKHYHKLQELQNTITVKLEQLPTPQDTLEATYQEIIQLLYQENIDSKLRADSSHTDLIEYFTQWTHQIKTPIAAMRLILQTEEMEHHQELSMELVKIEQYVEFVLQYLRLDTMSSDLELREYSLDDIVKQAVRKNAKLFIRKKISLHFDDLNCHVLTDEKWLLFVIEQILSNALKYTKEGSVSIYMDPNEEKTLVIQDTGIGIRAEDLPRVFDRGFTGFNGRMFKKSTGLGLYMCKQITSKLSHQMKMESEIGQGTKVSIDLKTTNIEIE
ncbi:sensor histidine kinase [Ornithinibacillus sp. BX22]|uniref:histidine kinase n=2 Tax=Ornithinibacillus TaxID=484508 RepID=A0A923L2X1_9BACI|nr:MULTISPECIES: sensor histidine kinase [Ornithinibacillus]MBC5635488.1 sensor histidine kinase [Ornithinibacillus hominis]MBS3679098.1 sensor histidine kinase [Ornithinibacillus massiliensis]